MTITSRWKVGIALAAASTMAVAGCGSDDDPDTADPSGELDEITWISPRGSLDVMDDYDIWAALVMGYFEELGIDVNLEAGPTEGTATTRFVAEEQADIGYPSPGVLTSSIDSGIEVVSIYNMIGGQVFNFAVPPDSDITSIADLEGRTISVADPGWKVIIDPMLVEAGVDPSTVELIETGDQWGQAVALGQTDAGLGWDGLRAQWAAQGIDVEWVIGRETSAHPSNSYAVRASDLETDEGQDLWTRFLQGVVMGMEFARANPLAAAQITYTGLPDLAATVEPQLAVDSLLELMEAYSITERAGDGWGYHDPDGWENYLSTIADLGQTSSLLPAEDVYTNELIEAANDIDLERVQADAEAFELDDVFSGLTVPEGYDY